MLHLHRQELGAIDNPDDIRRMIRQLASAARQRLALYAARIRKQRRNMYSAAGEDLLARWPEILHLIRSDGAFPDEPVPRLAAECFDLDLWIIVHIEDRPYTVERFLGARFNDISRRVFVVLSNNHYELAAIHGTAVDNV